MDSKVYWRQKHQKYATRDWINVPTIFAKEIISYFPKSGKLLDLGAGQGQDSRFFVRKGYEVVSTDFSHETLQLSKDKAEEAELKMKFEEIDLREILPFGDNTFDIVYSHLALHYFDQDITKQLFEEIYRVLKKDGILAILLNTINDPEVQESRQIGEDLYETSNGLIKRFFTEDYLKKLTKDNFEPLLVDSRGETYKDEIKTLIRFVGKRK